jgi:hypothetical protein
MNQNFKIMNNFLKIRILRCDHFFEKLINHFLKIMNNKSNL